MLLTLSVRNKDYKEWSGFFVTLVLHGEFNFFPSKLCLILAEEKHNFHLRRVRFYLGGSNAYLVPAGPSSFSTTVRFSFPPFLGMVASIRKYMKKVEIRNRQEILYMQRYMGLFQMFSHRRGWAFLKKTRIFMKSYPDNDENIQNILLNLPRTPAYSLVTAGSRAGWGSCLCAWPPPTSSACSPPPLQGHLQVNLPGGGRALDTPCLNCLKKYIFIHYSISAFTAADVSLQFYASVQSVQLHNVG